MKEKFCLNSIASFKDINSSSTNRSKTKQTYSFNKSPRFQTIQPICSKNTYGGQSLQRKNSGAGIGYGQRSDFTKCLTVSPSSSKYNLKTSFQDAIRKHKGCSMGLGRQKVTFDNYINKQSLRVPSATKYNNDKQAKNKAPIFSMRKKTKPLDRTMTIQPQNFNPGPGTYANPQLDLNSSNYASKFHRISYSSNRSKRFDSSDNKIPGPGKYNDITKLSTVGRYIVSSHQGGTKAKFDKNKRISKFDQIAKKSSVNPGPGNYKVPSQFGQYDGDVYRNFNTLDIPGKSSRKTNRQ